MACFNLVIDFYRQFFKIINYSHMKFSLEIGPKTEIDDLPGLEDVYITFLPG